MRRRHVALFVISAILMVPALALAIPRPPTEPANGTAQEIQVGQELEILASDAEGIDSPMLLNGREYRLEIRNTWSPTAVGSNMADARYETTNSGGNWNMTGKGLVVGPVNYGDAASCIANPCQYQSSHVYSVLYLGRGVSEKMRINDPGGNAGNTGSLFVTIFQRAIVTYSIPVTQTVEPSQYLGNQVIATVPKQTVSAPPVPGHTQPPSTVVPGQTLPLLGSITFRRDISQQLICMKLQVLNATLTDSCIANPSNTLPEPDDIPIGGSQTGQVVVCDNPKCEFSGVPPGGATVGGQTLSIPVPAGATVVVRLSWTADQARLYKTAVDDGENGNTLYAPINPLNTGDRNWFIGSLQDPNAPGRPNLTLSVKATRGGATLAENTITIPGLGQVIEALFTSRVMGS